MNTIQSSQAEIPAVSPDVSKDLLLAQYAALRSEIHQRIDQRQQLLTYTLIGAASFFGIGLQSWVSGVTVLCYPLLAFFLACAWGQHDNRISQLNGFLQGIEDRHLGSLGPGWESYRRTLWKGKPLSAFITLPVRGLFIGSELLALVIGLARFSADLHLLVVFVLLIIVDALAITMTLFVLTSHRTQVAHPQGKGKVA